MACADGTAPAAIRLVMLGTEHSSESRGMGRGEKHRWAGLHEGVIIGGERQSEGGGGRYEHAPRREAC